ncbi:NUDIX hydrolase [Nocardioides sp. SOB77]|uniref:NUDIX hydrolase n=1 Tax=Nocardioides oceani TaxID=3058369 RepID=A0ABT8FHR7_9ACTN|nr:NUDIX hydrolase [Nocardioides oceani]MDN4174070.1 NUDIX hydrolase [Nocardioides oceani]
METLASKRVYDNPLLSVREDVVRRADGSTGRYAVVDTADIAVVVPWDGERLHLVEQYRHPVAGRRWELPSGSAEASDGSDPETVARRELREETGLQAAELVVLGTLEVTPSLVAHRCTVFLATGLSAGATQRDAGEQDMRSAWFSEAEVVEMVRSGRLVDAKSIAALTLLRLRRPT